MSNAEIPVIAQTLATWEYWEYFHREQHDQITKEITTGSSVSQMCLVTLESLEPALERHELLLHDGL